MEFNPGNSPRQHASISPTQFAFLRQWAAGNFESDWAPPPAAVQLDDLPLSERPAMLDRAALDFCVADAFHPGCEVTWPIRHLTMFAKPFRIRHRSPGEAERDYGSKLSARAALAPDGPLGSQGPGGLTRWMAVPWHIDTAGCRNGYAPAYDPYLPSFWPARVPNEVLTREAHKIATDGNRPRAERLAAFAIRQRGNWFDPIADPNRDFAVIGENMVRLFGDMGLLELADGVAGDADLPPVMQVASFGPKVPKDLPKPAVVKIAAAMPMAVAPVPAPPAEDELQLPAPVRLPGHGR